jgi:hypothetical protein
VAHFKEGKRKPTCKKTRENTFLENMDKKLSAHDIWVKAQKEGLSKEEYKKLLIENGIIIKQHLTDTNIGNIKK